MKKNKKYLTDKTVDNLSEKKAANQLPKFILLDIATNACELLAGIGCNAINTNDEEVQEKMLELSAKMVCILEKMDKYPEIKEELEAERAIMYKNFTSMDEESKNDMLAGYAEHLKEKGFSDEEITENITRIASRLEG